MIGSELSRPYYVRERRRGLRLIGELATSDWPRVVGIEWREPHRMLTWIAQDWPLAGEVDPVGTDGMRAWLASEARYLPSAYRGFDTWAEAERWLEASDE